MNKIILTCVLFAIVSTLISCNQNRTSHNSSENEVMTDSIKYNPESLEFYRDTLIGKLDGVHTETLVAEPIGVKEDQDYPVEGSEGWYWKRRSYI